MPTPLIAAPTSRRPAETSAARWNASVDADRAAARISGEHLVGRIVQRRDVCPEPGGVDVGVGHLLGDRRVEARRDRHEDHGGHERRADARDRVVDRRRHAGVVLGHRGHERGREGRHHHHQADAEHEQAGQQIDEVVGRRQERRRPRRHRAPNASLSDGRRANQSRPSAMIAGPAVMNTPRAVARRELAEPRREEHEQQRGRHPGDTRRLLVVAERADQEDALERQRDVERTVDHERREVRHGEVPRPEQPRAARADRGGAPSGTGTRSPRSLRPRGCRARPAPPSPAADRGSCRTRARPPPERSRTSRASRSARSHRGRATRARTAAWRRRRSRAAAG